MLLEMDTAADDAVADGLCDSEREPKRTVEELIHLLRVDDPDLRVTPAGARRAGRRTGDDPGADR